MSVTEQYNQELYHYGVKGMKWGVRKFQQESANLDRRKAAYKKAKKEYSKAYTIADTFSMAGISPVKKHRQAQEKRWDDVAKKAEKANKLRQEYKTAKKEFNKNTTVGQKINRVLSTNGAKKTASAVAKIGMYKLTDDIFFGGAGQRAAKQAIKTTGRVAISAFVYAKGGRDIRWYD